MTIGTYGFRHGGVIYHSDDRDVLRRQQEEIAEKFRNDLSTIRNRHPITRVDPPTFRSLINDYDHEHLTDSIKELI